MTYVNLAHCGWNTKLFMSFYLFVFGVTIKLGLCIWQFGVSQKHYLNISSVSKIVS